MLRVPNPFSTPFPTPSFAAPRAGASGGAVITFALHAAQSFSGFSTEWNFHGFLSPWDLPELRKSPLSREEKSFEESRTFPDTAYLSSIILELRTRWRCNIRTKSIIIPLGILLLSPLVFSVGDNRTGYSSYFSLATRFFTNRKLISFNEILSDFTF